jgi:hypothetical protein
MYRAAAGSSAAQIREVLKKLVQARKIEIGLSYHIVFELLQKATLEHRADRIERARLLSELCERNALPYPSDLGQGFRFSNDGLWVPRIDLEEVEIENVVQHLYTSLLFIRIQVATNSAFTQSENISRHAGLSSMCQSISHRALAVLIRA